MPKIKKYIIKNYNSIFISTVMLFTLMIVPSNFKIYPIGVWALIVFKHFIKKNISFNYKYFIWFSLIYWGVALTLIYSSNISYGLSFVFEKYLSLLIFPLVFAMISPEDINKFDNKIHVFLFVFIVSVFLYLSISFLTWYYLTGFTMEQMIKHYITLIDQMGKLSIHPIYMSILTSLSILFSIYLIKETKNKKYVFLLTFFIISFFIFLLILARKGPILSLLISGLFFISASIKGKIKVFILLLLFGFLLMLFIFPNTKKRFKELIPQHIELQNKISSTGIRFEIYKSSFNLFKKEPILGYGAGDCMDVLEKQYIIENKIYLAKKRFSTHNQFLCFLIMGGALLLLVFLNMLGYIITLGIKSKNYLFISIIIFYIINMASENVLNRETGVVIFALLISFMGIISYYKNESVIKNNKHENNSFY